MNTNLYLPVDILLFERKILSKSEVVARLGFLMTLTTCILTLPHIDIMSEVYASKVNPHPSKPNISLFAK